MSLLAILAATPTARAQGQDELDGDVSVLGGGAWPQGATTRFSEPSWNISLRAAAHVPGVPGIIPTVGLSCTFFPRRTALVEDETDNFIVLAKEEKDQVAIGLNVGLQLGSPTRRGFFRPRAGIAPGFYLLSEDVKRTLPGDVDPYYSGGVLLGRLGWKGVVGADLFFTPRVGLALDFVYDQIWRLENGESGRYQGFGVGFVFAFDEDDVEPSSSSDPGADVEPEPESESE